MSLKVTMILFFGVIIFQSCKNQDSEKTEVEIDQNEGNDRFFFESEKEVGNEKFLDSVENYIIRDYLNERDLRSMSTEQRKFQVQRIDLNNDGKEEIFVNFVTSYFCGSEGCTVLLLNNDLTPITDFTARTPIYVEDTTENGWKVLIVEMEGKWRKLTFGEDTYELNPSVVEISPQGPTENAQILFDDKNADLKIFRF